jgi:hypothetical protein
LNPIPCLNNCEYQTYQVVQAPNPNQPVMITIARSMGDLPAGVMVADIQFLVNRPTNELVMLAKDGLLTVQAQDVKLTPEQQQSLNEAVRLLLEQCQFKLTFLAITDMQKRNLPPQFELKAQVQIQVL